MVAGRRPVAELLRAQRRRVHVVLAADPTRLPVDIADPCRERGVSIERADDSKLSSASGINAHQGVVAFADPLPLADLGDVSGGSGFLVALDEVVDPRNLGAVLRVAEATGADGVVISSQRSAPITPAVLKTAAGAAEWVPLAVVGNMPGALSEMRDRGRWIVGLDPDGTPLGRCGLLGEPVVLVAGAEGRGLRPKTRRMCDEIISIPMRGKIGSLNVSTAVAICAFVAAEMHESNSAR